MRRSYDPLTCIPSASAVRQKLAETEELARRLRILLATAEAIAAPGGTEAGIASRQNPCSLPALLDAQEGEVMHG